MIDKKALNETLRVSPFQLSCRIQPIMFRADGSTWMQGSRHYQIEITRIGMGRTVKALNVEYTQGPAHTKMPTLCDILYSVIQDARTVEDFADEWEMASEFGMEVDSKENLARVQGIWIACQKYHDWLKAVFSEDEREQLNTLFEDF